MIHPDDHERYEDHQQIDCEPSGYALFHFAGAWRLPSARHILRRKSASGCEHVHVGWL